MVNRPCPQCYVGITGVVVGTARQNMKIHLMARHGFSRAEADVRAREAV